MLARATLALALLVPFTGCVRVLELSPPDTVCVPDQAPGYQLPSQRWGLAAAHAARRLQDDPTVSPELDAAWFLATGWQTSAFACADYGPPWTASAEGSTDAGCLGIVGGTHHRELVALFPGIYEDDASYAGAFSGDAPETSALALAWTMTASHALWARPEVAVVPAEFYASVDDPDAAQQIPAALHHEGPWSSGASQALSACRDDVSACLQPDSVRHVEGVTDKREVLLAAPCHDEPLSADAVRAHVRVVTALWDEAEPDRVEQAALDALDGSGFHREAAAVLDAIERTTRTRLLCPEATLWSVYSLSCP